MLVLVAIHDIIKVSKIKKHERVFILFTFLFCIHQFFIIAYS